MTKSVTDRQISEFVGEVRDLLQDLRQADIEGLTDGLINDLMEQRNNDSDFRLADAKLYASELRLSAGLPASEFDFSRVFVALATATKSLWTFLKTFETTWFVIRGYLIYPFVFSPIVFQKIVFVPHSFISVLIVLALIAVSLFLGNGRGILRFLRYPLIFLNIAGVFASSFVLIQAQINYEEYSRLKTINESRQIYKGNQMLNYLCAFDSNGKQVEYSKLTDRLGFTVLTYKDIEPFSKDCTDEY